MNQIPEELMEADEGSLKRVAVMAELMKAQLDAVAVAQEALEVAKSAFTKTERVDLPELLREVGLSELKTESGMTVSLVDDIQCGISEERRERAHAWLKRRNLDGVIRTVLGVEFDKGESRLAEKIADKLRTLKVLGGRAVEVTERVHPQTLKALLKEQRALIAEKAGDKTWEAPPPELFGIHEFTLAKLTLPKIGKVAKKRK